MEAAAQFQTSCLYCDSASSKQLSVSNSGRQQDLLFVMRVEKCHNSLRGPGANSLTTVVDTMDKEHNCQSLELGATKSVLVVQQPASYIAG